MKIHVYVVVSLAILAFAPCGIAEDSVARAKELWERYVALERAFDPAAAELYADDAKIENTRTYPTGQKRTLTVPAADYRKLIRAALPLAKARGDTNTYSDVKYTAEGERIRITCTRFSELKKYSSPLSLLVGAAVDGKWLIFEEISESQP
jgi:hypothetical protein